MKRLISFSLAALMVLSAVSCKKDNPAKTEKEDVVEMSDLLKQYDIAAIVDWSYTQDAVAEHALFINITDAKYSRSGLPLTVRSQSLERFIR